MVFTHLFSTYTFKSFKFIPYTNKKGNKGVGSLISVPIGTFPESLATRARERIQQVGCLPSTQSTRLGTQPYMMPGVPPGVTAEAEP